MFDHEQKIVSMLQRMAGTGMKVAKGLSIQNSLRAAKAAHPDETLRPTADQWEDIRARFEYISEHQRILTKLRMKEN